MNWSPIHNDIIKTITEVTILAVAIYYVLKFIRGIRGAAVVTAFFTALIIVAFSAIVLHLQVLTWILSWFVGFFAISVLVLFQTEIRRMISEIGASRVVVSAREQRENIEVVIQGAKRLAEERFGGLIAIEQGINLSEITEGGVVIDCAATPEMLETIFFPNNAIHDGGVLMKNDRIAKAACVFPLSLRQDLSHSTGMRHRAGLGLSEETDAVVIIVSEETGYISYAYKGKLYRNASEEDLRAFLSLIFLPKKPKPKRGSKWPRMLIRLKTQRLFQKRKGTTNTE
ncbi:MAG TPA: diadenylate cyclase CdaA [Verrucomicrobiota bacterium]|jgi:diadenylate cyclase|nr:diadenylate cyclase CdaA [Verrucomicrobiota bacterium]